MRASHDEYIGRILQAIDTDASVSQRTLARELGIALGLTNLLLKRLVGRGLVGVSRVRPDRMRYLLTPTGLVEKARMSHKAFEQAVDRYRVARLRLECTFARASAAFPSSSVSPHKPVMFFGTGEVAEIGFICLQEFDLHLVGAFDDSGRRRFFDVPLYPRERLTRQTLELHGGARVIVLSLRNLDGVKRLLRDGDVPAEWVHWA